MERKLFCLAFSAVFVATLLGGSAAAQAQEAAKTRTLKVKVNYTGAGKVDEKHKIFIFLFDSADFVNGSVMPFDMKTASAKDETVTFTGITQGKVFIATSYDPTGNYDGQSGPPPSGSSMGVYSKSGGAPDGIDIEAGKTVDVVVTFDDSAKMP